MLPAPRLLPVVAGLILILAAAPATAQVTRPGASVIGRPAPPPPTAVTAQPVTSTAAPRLDQRILDAIAGASDPVEIEVVTLPAIAPPRTPGAQEKVVPGPDLSVSWLRLDAEGRIEYLAANATAEPTGLPFVADVFVNEERKDTIKHDPLAPRTGHAVTTAVQFGSCARGTIRVALDPQTIVAEASEQNNGRTTQLTPPCPDLAVIRIKKNWEDNNTRYRARITIQNVGDLATPPGVIMLLGASPGGVTGQGIPDQEHRELAPLAPGASYTFNFGDKVLGTSDLTVKVVIDLYDALSEKNEENNYKQETL
ncbi:MAG: CARDB domain-containing protein [Gemmatimonadota bacterium]